MKLFSDLLISFISFFFCVGPGRPGNLRENHGNAFLFAFTFLYLFVLSAREGQGKQWNAIEIVFVLLRAGWLAGWRLLKLYCCGCTILGELIELALNKTLIGS